MNIMYNGVSTLIQDFVGSKSKDNLSGGCLLKTIWKGLNPVTWDTWQFIANVADGTYNGQLLPVPTKLLVIIAFKVLMYLSDLLEPWFIGDM